MSDVYSSTAEETFCCCLFFSFPWSLLSQPKPIWACGFEKQKEWRSCGWSFYIRCVVTVQSEMETQGGLAASPVLLFSLHAVVLPVPRVVICGSPPKSSVIRGVTTGYCDWFPNKRNKTWTSKWVLGSSKSLPCKAAHLFLSHCRFSAPSGNFSRFVCRGSLFHSIKKWRVSLSKNLGWYIRMSISVFCGCTLVTETDSV